MPLGLTLGTLQGLVDCLLPHFAHHIAHHIAFGWIGKEAGARMGSKLEDDSHFVEKKNTKKNGTNFVTGDAAMVPKWAQKTVTLPPQKRGCHLITPLILKDIEADLAYFKCGLAHLFLQHTSASLTINENYDNDVLDDVETWLNGTVPEGRRAPWKHTLEGPDDMPAHIKSSMFGCAISLPITDGRLNLGTWQGIWLCEHRDHGSARKVVVTLTGA